MSVNFYAPIDLRRYPTPVHTGNPFLAPGMNAQQRYQAELTYRDRFLPFVTLRHIFWGVLIAAGFKTLA